MSNIYLTQHGTEVSKSGGRLLIKNVDGSVNELPSSCADCFVVMACVQITYGAVMEILRNGGSIIYLDSEGNIAGELGFKQGKARVLARQMQCYLNKQTRQELASGFVKSKILAQRNLLRIKNKSLQNTAVKSVIIKLGALAKYTTGDKSIEKLLGLEGVAAKSYFDTFGILINGTDLKWQGRRKHPAPDEINAMLSFAYALLEKDVRRAVAANGLAAGVGFLHELNYRKDSLIYDLMEVFRPSIADRFVLRCINLRVFTENDFVCDKCRCLFNDSSKKRFITAYEEFMGAVNEENGLTLRKQIDLEVKKLAKKLVAFEKVNKVGEAA